MLRLILAYEVVSGKMTREQAHNLLEIHGNKSIPLELDDVIEELKKMGIGM